MTSPNVTVQALDIVSNATTSIIGMIPASALSSGAIGADKLREIVDLLTSLGKLVATVRAGLTGEVSVAAVEDAIRVMAASLEANDAEADTAVDKRFPPAR